MTEITEGKAREIARDEIEKAHDGNIWQIVRTLKELQDRKEKKLAGRNPSYIKTHIEEFEDETCKILVRAKPSKITISQLTEAGFFVPINIFDIREYAQFASLEPEFFEVEIK